MAAFKVGQRVRVVRTSREPSSARELKWWREHGSAQGKTGVITRIPSHDGRLDCSVLLDDYPRAPEYDGSYAGMFYQLEPLTDPGADAFIERIKKLKPYEEPKVAPRQTEFSGSVK